MAEWLFERGWADWLWPLWALSAYISVELPHFGTHLAHPILCLLVGCVAGPVSAVPLLGVSWLASRPVRLVITPRWVELDGVRVELADLSALEVRDDRVVVGSLVSAPLLDPVGARRELVEVRRILPLDAAGSEREARADATRRLARLRGVGAGGG